MERSQGSLVVFYMEFTVETDPAVDDDGTRCVARASWVFNASQVDGSTIPGMPDLPPIEREANAEGFIAETGAIIRHGGDMAYYRPSTDQIQMPDERLFTGSTQSTRTEDYSALAHELTHYAVSWIMPHGRGWRLSCPLLATRQLLNARHAVLCFIRPP